MLPWIPAKPVKHFEELLSYIIAVLVVEGFHSLSLTIEASQFEWERGRERGEFVFLSEKEGRAISRVKIILKFILYM